MLPTPTLSGLKIPLRLATFSKWEIENRSAGAAEASRKPNPYLWKMISLHVLEMSFERGRWGELLNINEYDRKKSDNGGSDKILMVR